MPGNTNELQLFYFDPATDGDLNFNITTALKENWDKIDAAFRSRIKGAVADLAALKAINMTDHPDNPLIFVKALGIYRYDAAGEEAPDDDFIVQPTTGPGRWKKIIGVDGSTAATKTINEQLSSGVINMPSIGIGIQNIYHTGETPIFPTIEGEGKHYVNPLGKKGDCENPNDWVFTNSSGELDPVNKVFGAYALAVTSTVAFSGARTHPIPVTANKYYLASGYVKTETGQVQLAIYKNEFSGSAFTYLPYSAHASMTRIGARFQAPADMTSVVIIFRNDSIGKFFMDGIMLNEITAEEYSSGTVEDLLEEYPYGESFVALQNPYFENRRGNLFNFDIDLLKGKAPFPSELARYGVKVGKDEYSSDDLIVEGEKIKAGSTGSFYRGIGISGKLKPNTQYTVSADIELITTAGVNLYIGTVLASLNTNGRISAQVTTDANGYLVSPTGYVAIETTAVGLLRDRPLL
jgi:hypothetical protein